MMSGKSSTPQRVRRAPNAGFPATWLYRVLLRGPSPKGVTHDVAELWPGDPARGAAILDGHFAYEGESHRLTSAAEVPESASAAWRAWFHGHGWLKHLTAMAGGERGGEAPFFAREWLSAWMDAHSHYDPIAWAPEVTAERVVNWVRAWDFLVRGDAAAGPFEKMLRRTIGRDVRHIAKTPPPAGAGYARLHTLKGQTFAALALKGRERSRDKALRLLEAEVDLQVLPDGGHVERNPERLALVLQDLLELRALCAAVLGQVPPFLQNAIDRATPMLRQLRHPDGTLALFNGGREGDPARIDQLLVQTESGSKAPGRAPYAGFQHLSAGNLHVIMDCGRPGGPGKMHHAGTLSFELSVGPQRLIVNCGARLGESDPWRTALAATAAHSTLTVNDTSSAAFAIDGALHRGPDHVTCQRTDSEDGVLVEASHDGYLNAFGLTHHRALYVGPGGNDIRGEDRLTGTGGEYFTIRFHLHPAVKASALADGSGALLRFGTRGKQTWRLRASAGEVKIEDSVYLGHLGEHRRTEQITISGPLTGNGALVKWALTREGQ